MNYKDAEILLVEDNPHDVELTLRSLQKHNLANRVQVVKDGAEALDFIFNTTGSFAEQANHLKVILLDLKLPKVSGLEVLQRLKDDERTRTIPVVVLTSSHEDRDIEECYRLGVNSYVVKPVEFESFAKTVAEMGFYWLLVNKPA
ncbi:MAG: response regulator [Desulfobaccales bacterium]|jgi:CheY-like chemotaxis protein